MPASTGSTRDLRRTRRRVLFWVSLSVFVLSAIAVIARRAIGMDQARTILELRQRRIALETDRARAEDAVREATSRRALAPIVARELGLHVPADTQVILITRP